MLPTTPYSEAKAKAMTTRLPGKSVLLQALIESGKLHATPGDLTASLRTALDHHVDAGNVITMPVGARRPEGGLIIDITLKGRDRHAGLVRHATTPEYEATGKKVIEQSEGLYEAAGNPTVTFQRWNGTGCNGAHIMVDGKRVGTIHNGHDGCIADPYVPGWKIKWDSADWAKVSEVFETYEKAEIKAVHLARYITRWDAKPEAPEGAPAETTEGFAFETARDKAALLRAGIQRARDLFASGIADTNPEDISEQIKNCMVCINDLQAYIEDAIGKGTEDDDFERGKALAAAHAKESDDFWAGFHMANIPETGSGVDPQDECNAKDAIGEFVQSEGGATTVGRLFDALSAKGDIEGPVADKALTSMIEDTGILKRKGEGLAANIYFDFETISKRVSFSSDEAGMAVTVGA